MTDKPRPDYLDRLRIVEGFLRHQLDQVQRWITEEEQKIERAQARHIPPPPPDWLLQHGLNRDSPPVAVHVGGCHMAGSRSRGISRQEAMRRITEGVEACSHCRPDTELGILD